MRTRSSSNLIVESSTTLKRRNRRRSKQRVEPFSLEETSVVTMADQRTMAELLQAPTEGYGDAIVIPTILAENFELKHGLLNLVTSKQFYGFEKEDPHAHIRWFNKITSTIKYKDVPNSSIKLMLFPFSIEGAARIWLKKEPPRSILTWEDLVSKFINQFFPPSKTTNLRNEITNFQQKFEETFSEACDRFKDLLRACPHHDDWTIIENKSKVCNSRNKPVVTKVSTNTPSSSTSYFPEIAALADVVKAMLLQKSSPPASVKAVVEWEPEVTKDTVQPSTKNIQPHWKSLNSRHANDKPVVALKPKSFIPYPSRANKQKLREKDDNLASKFIEIFRELHFEAHSRMLFYHMRERFDSIIDVIGRLLCEEYAQEVLGFSDSSTSGNPTPSLDHILSTSYFPFSHDPYEEVTLILEEMKLVLANDLFHPPVELMMGLTLIRKAHSSDSKKLLNMISSSPPLNRPPKEANFEEIKTIKSSIDDPSELELKDLQSHLEYAFLEGTGKLPVIISKELKDEEKAALLKVLKSYKRTIAWKISDIKGIDPRFCTHKILMEDDFKLAV
ncbi:reverse transcriptase domain-containing protein [Tanacetum coccineum]